MRASEHYAQGIRGFFVDWGVDAINQPRGAHVAAAAMVAPGRDAIADDDFADDDFADDECTGCSCHIYAPCHHCENNHDEET